MGWLRARNRELYVQAALGYHLGHAHVLMYVVATLRSLCGWQRKESVVLLR